MPKPTEQIMDTITNLGAETRNTALTFQACLGCDKGVPSELIEVQGGYKVVADDGKAVVFLQGSTIPTAI